VHQPWAPLAKPHHDILKKIASLSSARAYYPENLRVIQQVEWDDGISV
jgi:hypothetical protein